MSSGQKAVEKKKLFSTRARLFRDIRASTAGPLFSPVDEVLFRMTSTRCSAPVNMLRRDASHPSQSPGAPQVRHEWLWAAPLMKRRRYRALRSCVSLP